MGNKRKRNKEKHKEMKGKVPIPPWGMLTKEQVFQAMFEPLPCLLCRSIEQYHRATFIPGNNEENARLGATGSKFRVAAANVCSVCYGRYEDKTKLEDAMTKALHEVVDDSWRKAEAAKWS